VVDTVHWRWLQRGLWVLVLAYVAGIGLPIASLTLALYAAVVGGLRFSQGGVGHAWQGTALVLLAQAAAFVRFGAVGGLWTGWPSPDARAAQRVAVFWCQQALVAVYLTSGVTKLLRSRWEWVSRSRRLPLQIVKAAEQQFHEALDVAARDRQIARAERLAARPGLTRLAAALGLAVEVASPLFLVGPGMTFAGGVLLILFHRVNGAVLGHRFGQLQVLLLILMANPALLV
jgi:hypothetical protein